MFKDIYKAANDDIKADSALLEKVLRQKKRKKPSVLKYSSIAAACAAVAVSLAAVPTFLNTTPPKPENKTAVVTPVPAGSKTETVRDSADKDKNEAAQDTADTEKSEKKEEVQSSLADTERNRQSASTSQRQSASTSQRQSASTAKKQQSAPAEQKQQNASTEQGGAPAEQGYQNVSENASASEEAAAEDSGTESARTQGAAAENAIVTEDTAEDSVMQSTGEKKNFSAYVKTAVLCVNSVDYGGYYDTAEEVSGYIGDLAEGGYESTEWSLNDYYDYLGENVRAKLSLPPDLAYIGENSMSVSLDSNGVPSLDSMIFPYEGSGGRSVTVMTSKNTLSAQAHLEDERYKKSDINGSAAVVIGGGGSYKCYMAEGGISYIVTARGVSEDELLGILVSIGG